MTEKKSPVQRWNGKELIIDTDFLASETICEISVNNVILTRLLCSLGEYRELAVGHLISEGYCDMKEIDSISREGQSVQLSISKPISRVNFSEIITTSCGACDRENFDALNNPKQRQNNVIFSVKILQQALVRMRESQGQFEHSGGTHCSALVDVGGNIRYLAEDIGRHNSTDKVIGKALLDGADLSEFCLLLSGRCAWDLCAKAVRSNISAIASLGAISDLAASCARANMVSIAGFLKQENGVII
ncbi:MAG: formate dehydrogenase accessory sulfurtransferase FdhD, partial [Candidatus Thermoplasmatota archaeon]|nr:formate dehydrogenase accessory sulfurtransferase FdhD [Candidatus Thermoplasmatota archaeon]